MPGNTVNTATAADSPEASQRRQLSRDQRRALFAYRSVARIGDDQKKDYKIAVGALGGNILRSGLAAAMAGLERRKKEGGSPDTLLSHLVEAGIPGLVQPGAPGVLGQPLSADNLPDKIRHLETSDYILATREALQVVLWLKRAVQAKFEGV